MELLKEIVPNLRRVASSWGLWEPRSTRSCVVPSPGELPVEQASKLLLTINLITIKQF
jgi:hypothetical protein